MYHSQTYAGVNKLVIPLDLSCIYLAGPFKIEKGIQKSILKHRYVVLLFNYAFVPTVRRLFLSETSKAIDPALHVRWGWEGRGTGSSKVSPPCTLLYPRLSENLDRQTQGCWPYFDSLGNFKWLNHNFFFEKNAKKGLKNAQSTLKCIALTCAHKLWKVMILQSMLLKNISTGSYVWSQNSIIKKRPLEQRTAFGLKFS